MPKQLSMPAPTGSILETELVRVAEQKKIDTLRVVETDKGFYVVAEVRARDPEVLYLATRREPERPRLFRDLERLNNLLRELYPEGAIELLIETKYQAKSKTAGKKVSKKKASKKSVARKK